MKDLKKESSNVQATSAARLKQEKCAHVLSCQLKHKVIQMKAKKDKRRVTKSEHRATPHERGAHLIVGN